MVARATGRGAGHTADDASLKPITDAAAELTASASRTAQALHAIESTQLDAVKEEKNKSCAGGVEQALLAPVASQGARGSSIDLAPGSYTGYAAEICPA